MSSEYPQQSTDDIPSAEVPLPEWWPILSSPTIPWHDGTDARNDAMSIGSEHNRLMDAYRALSERHGGGYVGMLRGMLAEYAMRELISERDKQRLNAILDALERPSQESLDTVARLHEEATADAAAKPAALAVSAVAAASARGPATNVAIDTGGGLAHEIAHTIADLGGAVLSVPAGAPAVLIGSVAASLTADRHHVHVEVTIQ